MTNISRFVIICLVEGSYIVPAVMVALLNWPRKHLFAVGRLRFSLQEGLRFDISKEFSSRQKKFILACGHIAGVVLTCLGMLTIVLFGLILGQGLLFAIMSGNQLAAPTTVFVGLQGGAKIIFSIGSHYIAPLVILVGWLGFVACVLFVWDCLSYLGLVKEKAADSPLSWKQSEKLDFWRALKLSFCAWWREQRRELRKARREAHTMMASSRGGNRRQRRLQKRGNGSASTNGTGRKRKITATEVESFARQIMGEYPEVAEYLMMIASALRIIEEWLASSGLEQGPPEAIAWYDLDTGEISFARQLTAQRDLNEDKVRELLASHFTPQQIDQIIAFIRNHELLHQRYPRFNEEAILWIQTGLSIESIFAPEAPVIHSHAQLMQWIEGELLTGEQRVRMVQLRGIALLHKRNYSRIAAALSIEGLKEENDEDIWREMGDALARIAATDSGGKTRFIPFTVRPAALR